MNHPYEQLPFYAAGQLTGEERVAIEQHLSGCAECRAALDEWRTLAKTVHERAASRVKSLPPLKMISPNGRVKTEMKTMTTIAMSRQERVRREVWMTFAATLALMLVGVLLTLRGSNTPAKQNTFDSLQPITLENAEELTLLKQIGRGRAEILTVSPDGQTLLVGTPTGIYRHRMDNLQNSTRLGDATHVTGLLYSPDGSQLAVSTGETIELWNAGTGQVLKTFDHPHRVLNFSDDHLMVFECEPEFECEQVAYSLLDIANGEMTSLHTSEMPLWSASAMSPEGSLFAISKATDTGSEIEVWEVGAAEPLNRFETSISPGRILINEQTVVASGSSLTGNVGFIYVGDVETGEDRMIEMGGAGHLIGFSEDGKSVLYYAEAREDEPDIFAIQPLDGGEATTVSIGEADEMSFPSLGFSANRLVVGDENGDLQVWDVSDLSEAVHLGTIDGYTAFTDGLTFISENSVAFQSYRTLQIWDVMTDARIDRETLSSPFYRDIALAVNDTGVLAYADDKNVSLWNEGETSTIERNKGNIITMRYVEDTLVAASYLSANKKIYITRHLPDGTTEEVVFSPAPDHAIHFYGSGWLSKEGDLFFMAACFAQTPSTCDENWGLLVYDTQTGEIRASYEEGLYQADFYFADSRDGLQVAEAFCQDNTVERREFSGGSWERGYCVERALRLRDLETLEIRWEQSFEGSGIYRGLVEISPDDRLMAHITGGMIYLIETETGNELASFPVAEEIDGLAFNEEGTLLAVGSMGTVSLWGVPGE